MGTDPKHYTTIWLIQHNMPWSAAVLLADAPSSKMGLDGQDPEQSYLTEHGRCLLHITQHGSGDNICRYDTDCINIIKLSLPFAEHDDKRDMHSLYTQQPRFGIQALCVGGTKYLNLAYSYYV